MQPVKRTKFSPSNIEEQERNFIHMHNIAMGYEPRPPVTNMETDIIALANASFPVPSSVHSTFQDLLRVQKQAKFDCFKQPSSNCACYKCTTYWGRMDSDLDYFEKIQEDKSRVDLLGSDSDDDSKPKAVFNVRSDVLNLPKGQPDFNLVAKNVAHFYVGLPAFNGEHPSTPACSTAVYDLPNSDNGKIAAQEHWIKMQQMTPTRLCF